MRKKIISKSPMIPLHESIWTESYSSISHFKTITKLLDLVILSEKEFFGGIEALLDCPRKYDVQCYSENGELYAIEL